MRIISRDEDYIIRTCVDHDFDEKEIIESLDMYMTEDKYKGLKDYEWNTTETRQDKKVRMMKKK